MSQLSDAIKLANHFYANQTDASGLPAILHPLRVLAAVGDYQPESIRVLAVLHDIVEDAIARNTPLGAGAVSVPGGGSLFCALLSLGLDVSDYYSPLSAITRLAPAETYAQYIERVAESPEATYVKILDLQENIRRANGERTSLVERYEKALERLQRAQLTQ